MKKTFTILLCFCLVSSPFALASDFDPNRFAKEVAKEYAQQESADQTSTIEKKQKSHGLALGLGLDPIPGDGLIYTGHPIQGALALIIGGLGGTLFSLSLAEDCSRREEHDLCENLHGLFIPLGALMYAAGYAWDLIGSTNAAKKFKK